jgi:catechol 2,3-dioxygenase-like lactoylglutathione lyase family enzyme
MLSSADLVAFVATTDLDRARAFYGGVLGLEMVDESPFACVFASGGTMLRVTRVDEVSSAAYTVLGWSVGDIERDIRALTERGVRLHRYDGMVQDGLGIWTAPNGARIAWFGDPDGNVLSLTQFA